MYQVVKLQCGHTANAANYVKHGQTAYTCFVCNHGKAFTAMQTTGFAGLVKMTVKEAVKQLNDAGIVCRRVMGQYRVAVKGKPQTAYFADNFTDAIDTGIRMAESRVS